MTMKNFCIAVLCVMSAVFVLTMAGYFIFCIRVKSEKNAIKVKRHRKKNSIWWFCCWLIWVVVFLLDWSGAKHLGDEYNELNYKLLSVAGGLLTILLVLNFFVWKYSYVTSQRVYQPLSFGLAYNKKKIMYKISGDTLKLWFNDSIMPKEYTILEDKDKLEQMLKDNYKLNKIAKE
jgi:heme/copper-type cytochrome/quinol oxidase subunit 2